MYTRRLVLTHTSQPTIAAMRQISSRVLALLFASLWVATAYASDPSPGWGSGWNAHVRNTYCELRREYHIPFRNDPNRRGFLTGTAFHKAFIRFVANTQLLGNLIPPESLGVITFHLYVYPEDFPVAASEMIVEASLGGVRTEANVVSNAEIHIFSLDEDESAKLLQRFIDNEVVDFELILANGDKKAFKIYPSGDRTFYVWADMFQTCIESHKGKNR
jgi:hypothetical protein